ncbi:hypothetical protein PtrSN002B_011383 [Pyrenophora tritici-repentis]|nr:hypothetical protein A1F94_001059 [Pyrenophora tritici-repentis]KAI0604682.1 hypothetical protein TUN205_11070 [Pyrenophora tritici-repentis]KAI1524001.1 hypothetical protein PtrSN001C_011230 [Pyrenophora tritici-repentis]KAI1528235.1 hypothetical protein PtrSN002B_011383 [Pyrenophora tritici-repentis]KAI1560220.1 hypothetical protein PtrEW4_011310 [Pyrenophora tritici-repentis]
MVVNGDERIRLRGTILNECNMTFLSAIWGINADDFNTIWIIGGKLKSPGTRVPKVFLELHWELVHEGI